MSNEIFRKFYNQLNSQQKEAVDTLEGPVMVVAGPGTGKTQVLILRIANILIQSEAKPGTIRCPAKPEEILALTFTENAAFNMKRRLFVILGPSAYRARIATFHSFCNDIILENPESFAFVKSTQAIYEGARHISEVEQAKIIEEILQNGKFERLNINNPFVNYIMELVRAIGDFKREGILPEDYKKIIDKEEERVSAADDLYHEKGAHKGKMKAIYREKIEKIAKNREVYEAYKKYQEMLDSSGGYDFNDMILFVLRALRLCGVSDTPHLLEKLRDKYKYILVDEHQDVNSAQNEVVELLAGEYPANVFVVGDEKQSIFRFQGASLENILYFKNKFSQCRVITLQKNYRSPQAIIDCAQSVIANNTIRLGNYLCNISDSLVSECAGASSHGASILEAANQDDELYFIVQKIRELRENGAPLGEIAVLYRDNWEGQEVAAALERAGIPHCIESNRNLFGDKTIAGFISFLRIVSRSDLSRRALRSNELDEELVSLLFADFAEIPAMDIFKLADLHASEYSRKSLFSLIVNKPLMERSGIASARKIYDLAESISKCAAAARQKNTLSAFETAARESGFLNYIVSLNSQDAISKFNALFNELKSAGGDKQDYLLGDFLEHLELLRKYKIPLTQKKARIPVNAVRLMTAHKSKGLEFDYVIVSGCTDMRWGGRKRQDNLKILAMNEHTNAIFQTEPNNGLEDARRLFFVALTRAKKGVFATCALENYEGREQFPSRFFSEIRPELIFRIDAAAHTADVISEILHSSAQDKPRLGMGDDLLIQDAEYLRSLFLKRGFAATHLNNYLECPWKLSLIHI